MQEILHSSDATIIKWLFGFIGFLIVLLNGVLGYLFRDIHIMVKEDHELLKTITAEHKMIHKDKTGMDD
jgi:hypothetical protein